MTTGTHPQPPSVTGEASILDADEDTLRSSLEERIASRIDAIGGAAGPDSPDLPELLDRLGAEPRPGLGHPPATVRRLLHSLNRPNVPFSRLVEISQRDPGLVQAILRHANSAYYGSRGTAPITSARLAIQRIGLSGLHSVVYAELARGLICRPGEPWDDAVTRLWGHLTRTGELARRLSRAFPADAEETYTLGLLHDVGKMVIFSGLALLRKRHRRRVRIDSAIVFRMLDELHAPLGGVTVLGWGMGTEAALAIAHHHHDPPPPGEMVLCDVIVLANHLDRTIQEGREVDLEELWRRYEFSGSSEAARPIVEDAISGSWEDT